MALGPPERTRTYQNHHLDSTRWDAVTPRPDDIIITTAYKAGTTWTQRIVAALKQGQTQRSVAECFGVSLSSVQRYDRLDREHGSLSAKPIPGRPRSLTQEHEPLFRVMLAEGGDWTLCQMARVWHERTGVLLPKSTLHDHLKRWGFRYKKRVNRPKNALLKSVLTSANR